MILNLQNYRLTLLGKDLPPVDSVKDLGVVFDSKLSFNHNLKQGTANENAANVGSNKGSDRTT